METENNHIEKITLKIFCNECRSRLNRLHHACRICGVPMCRACMDRDCQMCAWRWITTGNMKYAKRHYIMRPDAPLRQVFEEHNPRGQYYVYRIDGFDIPFRQYIKGRVRQGVVTK